MDTKQRGPDNDKVLEPLQGHVTSNDTCVYLQTYKWYK